MKKILCRCFSGLGNNTGAVLPLVLFISTISVILAAGITIMINEDIKQTIMVTRGNEALYIAEGGAHKAISQILAAAGAYTGESDTALGKGAFTVNVTSLGNSLYEIISTGYIPDSLNPKEQRRIKVIFILGATTGSSSGIQFVHDEIFSYVLAAKNGLNLTNACTVNSINPSNSGHIYSNADILCKNAVVVNGDAYAVGTITLQNASVITGSKNPGSSPIVFPPVDADYYKAKAQEGGTLTGDQTFTSGVTTLGPVYINGNLTVQNTGSVILAGCIYVTGNITLKNTAYMKGGYVIFSEGIIETRNATYFGASSETTAVITTSSSNPAIKLGNASVSSNCIFYAPDGGIEISNACTIKGSLVADSINIKNASQINLMSDNTLDLPGSTKVSQESKIISWKEIPIS
ncbi:MAG: hypothetical protein ABH857_04375 [Elusimicrobiota bacterium]